MKFLFMRDHSTEFNIGKMAKTLRVSRQGYYEFLKREPCKRKLENQRLLEKIKITYKKGRGTYGSPRIHRELKKEGEACSRKRVARLMKKEKLQAKMRKRWKATTKVDSKAVASPNYLNQNFTVERENQVWVSDITYIQTAEGWLYLAVFLDLFSRRIVGMSMGESLETDLVVRALKQAICRRGVHEGLVHHSDRGCQYTSKEFKEITAYYGIRLSMSAKGRCYDNAVAESFFHTLKTEHTSHCSYKTRDEAINSIFEYVEVFYNRSRLHSFLDYNSPEDFEVLEKSKKQAVA
jgi:putative transposase